MSSFLTEYLQRQKEWSTKTFNPGKRTIGITEHIKKEIEEIRQKPTDVMEWVDIIILALDGYWRAGGDPKDIEVDLHYKQRKNFNRTWPTPTSEDEAVEHDRTGESSQ